MNGPESVWIDRGAGLEPAGVTLRDEVAVRRLAQRMAVSQGGGSTRRPHTSTLDCPMARPARGDTAGGTAWYPLVDPRSRKRAFTRRPRLTPPAGGLLAGAGPARVAFLVSGGTARCIDTPHWVHEDKAAIYARISDAARWRHRRSRSVTEVTASTADDARMTVVGRTSITTSAAYFRQAASRLARTCSLRRSRRSTRDPRLPA